MRYLTQPFVICFFFCLLAIVEGQLGCEKNWLFLVATGRSGSTSLMQMLNLLPEVYIAGENAGMFQSLYDLYNKRNYTTYIKGRHKKGTQHAWWGKKVNNTRLDELMRKYTEAVIGRNSLNESPYSWIGFKEIRFRTSGELDYLLNLFQCCKVVLNFRRNTSEQHKSSFKQNVSPHKLLQINAMMKTWAKRHSERVFTITTEEIIPENMDRLAEWLGFPECHFSDVLHSHNGGYNLDSRKVMSCN